MRRCEFSVKYIASCHTFILYIKTIAKNKLQLQQVKKMNELKNLKKNFSERLTNEAYA